MRWWLYNLLFAVGYVCMLPRFFLRMKRRGGYRARFSDRFGHYPEEVKNSLQACGPDEAVWIHAVSVGEVYVAGQMMRALREEDPDIRFVLSTTSSTGWKEAGKQVTERDILIYHPIDFIPSVHRALKAIRPKALILTESEIWPNLILSCRDRDIPVFLINARISDRSAPRYRMLRYWFGPVLKSFTAIFAQSALDRERLIAAGADPERVEITGSFKFDVAHRAPEKERAVAEFLKKYGLGEGKRILLGGSTWPGEDQVLLDIYRRLRGKYRDLRLVIVPRHFEKADAVQENIERTGLRCIRKSGNQEPTGALLDDAERGRAVWVGDTTGELMGFYGCADLVFVGKSLCEHGAQNMIEPCLCGKATLVGPYTENFRPVISDLLENEALIQVRNREELTETVDTLLEDNGKREALASRAGKAVLSRKGVVGRCAKTLSGYLKRDRRRLTMQSESKSTRYPWMVWAALAQVLLGVWIATWLRALDVISGPTMLAGLFCTGTTLIAFVAGGLFSEWGLKRVRSPARYFSVLFLLAAGAAAILLGQIDDTILSWQKLLVDGSRSPTMLFSLLMNSSLLFFSAAGLLSGATILVLELTCMRRGRGTSGNRAGLLSLATGIFPLLLGCFIGRSSLLSSYEVESVTRVIIGGFGLLALSAALSGKRPTQGFSLKNLGGVLLVLALGAGIFLYSLYRQPKKSLLTSGVFSRLIHRDTGFAYGGTPLFEKRTARHVIAVYEDPDYQFVFTQDGRPLLFGNRFHTARTLSAYIPLLLNPEIRKAAVTGPEAGFYLPFLQRGGLADLSYTDADPLCVNLALATDRFMTHTPDDAYPLPLPKARIKASQEYDLLFVADNPIWVRGASLRYSKSNLKRYRGALSEKGMLAIHIDGRALSKGRFVTLAKDFLQIFPHAQFWNAGRFDWLFIGATRPIEASASKMQAFFQRDAVSHDFARAGILSLPEIFPSMLCDERGIRPFLDKTDPEQAWQSGWNLPDLILGGGDHILGLNELEECRQRDIAWFKEDGMDRETLLAIRNRTDRNRDARSLAILALAAIEEQSRQPLPAVSENESEETRRRRERWTLLESRRRQIAYGSAKDAARINPRDILLANFVSSLELEGRRRIAIGDFEGAKRCYNNLLDFDEDMAIGHYGVGYCTRALGDLETAFNHFVRAVRAVPKQIGYRLELAQVSTALNRFDEAERQYREILRLEPDLPDALFHYARILVHKLRPKKAFKQAISLAERACVLTHWEVSEYAYGLADIYMDAGRIMEGIGLKKRLKQQGLSRKKSFKLPREKE